MAIHPGLARTVLIGITATLAVSACGSEEPAPTAAPTTATTTTSSAPVATTSTTAPATTAPATTSAAATAEPAPTRSTSTKPQSGNGVLSGSRQVVIKPVPTFESVLALNAKGRLGLTDGESDSSLFVFTPVGRQYLIKTAKADANSGEPSCLSVQANGSSPLTVVAAPCDAGAAAQAFEVDARGASYAISNRSAFLQVVRGELIAEELGDGSLRTTFELVDNGKASLPALD